MIILDTLSLPEDLHWVDEFAWTPVAASLDYFLSGSGDIQLGTRLIGRPITLEAEDERGATRRSMVLALKALADLPGKQMTLNYHGRTFTVVFAPGAVPFDAEPWWREWPDENTDTWLIAAIRLIVIEEL